MKNILIKIRVFVLFTFVFFLGVGSVHAAGKVKPRILIIPFDNVIGNKDYDWMSSSIAENLKAHLLATGRFEVMDAALLKKINPNIKLKELTDKEATRLALKLNCEAAIIGRYIIKKKGKKYTALIQVEGVDAISNKSILIKSEYAEIDGTIFSKIESLSKIIVKEFIANLPPLKPGRGNRDAKLEKLIARTKNPPKGFLDDFSITALRQDKKVKVKLKPEFDIDTFTYHIRFVRRVSEVQYEYTLWGKTFKPYAAMNKKLCVKNTCTFNEDDTEYEMIIAKRKPGKNKKEVLYKFVFHMPPKKPLSSDGPTARFWLTAGYPFLQSFSFIHPDGNPAAINAGEGFPYDDLGGLFYAEAGIVPGWKLIGGIQPGFAVQLFYGTGEFYLLHTNNTQTVTINMLSIGGGFRIDRPFTIASWYEISPFIGFYIHYQVYGEPSTGSSFNNVAFTPEIGINQYFWFTKSRKWKINLSAAMGSFLYSNQNLGYFRIGAGVEYAIR
ncbi:MAG: hypothetical protein ABUK01_14195 [Leptospirales bacterium]